MDTKLILFLAHYFVVVLSHEASDKFHEELLIKPLASGHVYTYFQFTTLWQKQHHQNACKYSFSLQDRLA